MTRIDSIFSGDLEPFKPYGVQLHLSASPAFARKFGKKVKAFGGRYSSVQGYTTYRSVFLPLTMPGAIALGSKLLKEFPNSHGYSKSKTTTFVMFEGGVSLRDFSTSRFVAHTMSLGEALEDYARSLNGRVAVTEYHEDRQRKEGEAQHRADRASKLKSIQHRITASPEFDQIMCAMQGYGLSTDEIGKVLAAATKDHASRGA